MVVVSQVFLLAGLQRTLLEGEVAKVSHGDSSSGGRLIEERCSLLEPRGALTGK